MSGVMKEIFYFERSGPVNTEKVIELAKKRVLENKIKYVVFPSSTGETALKIVNVFKGSPVKLICVSTKKEDSVPLEMLEKWGTFNEIPELVDLIKKWKREGRSGYSTCLPSKEAKKLEALGVEVVYGDSPYHKSPLNGPVKYPGLKTIGQLVVLSQRLTCTGIEVSVKVSLMAANAGAIPRGEEIVAMGGTESGLDAAIVVRPGPSEKIFDEHEGVDVREIICKPKNNCGMSGKLLEKIAPE
jgi:uncharacterized protein